MHECLAEADQVHLLCDAGVGGSDEKDGRGRLLPSCCSSPHALLQFYSEGPGVRQMEVPQDGSEKFCIEDKRPHNENYQSRDE